MTDVVALWVGYIVLYTGGGLLALTLVGLAGWQVVEWWWRKYNDFKFLREFVQWKKGRYPG